MAAIDETELEREFWAMYFVGSTNQRSMWHARLTPQEAEWVRDYAGWLGRNIRDWVNAMSQPSEHLASYGEHK